MARRILKHPKRTGRFCFIYLRVSKGEKVQMSVPAQDRLARGRAEAEGFIVVGVYKDEKGRGVRREGLHQMLADLDANDQVGAVFFWDYRRLWGHQEQYRRLNARAVRAGYRLVDSKGKDFTSETAMEKFVANMHSNISELETETVGERAHDINSAKVQGIGDLPGQLVSRPPLGVRVEKFVNDDGQLRTRKFVEPHDMAIVRRILGEYASNRPTYRIAEGLLADKIATSRGKETWSVAGLRAIIDNTFYIGEMRWNRTGTEWEIDEVTGDKIKRVRARGEHEHLTGKSPFGVILAVDPNDPDSVDTALQLFATCQRIRDKKGRERPKRRYPLGVLEGLVHCGRCGKMMTRSRCGNKNRRTGLRDLYFNYSCPYRTNIGTGCDRSHSMAELQVFRKLALLVTEHGGDAKGRVTWRPLPPDTKAVDRAIQEAEREVTAARLGVQQIEKAWQEKVYDTAAEYKGLRTPALQRVVDAEAALQAAKALKSQSHAPVVEKMSDDLAVALAALVPRLQNDELPLDVRREAAARLISRIDVNNPTICVVLAPVVARRAAPHVAA